MKKTVKKSIKKTIKKTIKKRHHIYLIPGFFGFASIGGISYFQQVRETLKESFERRDLHVEIFDVSTMPTASLTHRARKLAMCIRDTGGLDEEVTVHLIGHSTGALDARLLCSTSVDLGLGDLEHAIRPKIKTLVSVAGPHYGTPLSNFFTTFYGKNLLYLVSLFVIVGLWRKPISFFGSMVAILGKLNNLLGLDETLIHQITNNLLKEFGPEEEKEVRHFLHSILEDQGAMIQITPEGMELFNATTLDNPEIRYVSYATSAPPPIETIKGITFRHMLTPLNKILYGLLWTLTSRAHPGYPYHPPLELRDLASNEPLPFAITESMSDGVVPTLSQVWGEFRGVVRADHLDIIGHYLRGPFDKKRGADWFGSGAKFDRSDFQLLWNDVASVLMDERNKG